VELRDVLPTFLEAAGASTSRPLDGRSLLSLLRREGSGWREWIDLEHNICYSDENHWNALTDSHWKYIFHARDGEEQLFHLDQDPHELTDLAGDPRLESTLRSWRARMMDHLSERGDEFVRNGRLTLRPRGMMTSPNFPGYEGKS
jgi:arylsulfatase A-like enzyme